MPDRYAMDVWAPGGDADRFMRNRDVKSPAFEQAPGGGFQLTADAQRVRDLIQQRTGRSYDIRPANSVMAFRGQPIWGGGGGQADTDSGIGYVDPLLGDTFVAAHEGGHAVAPSELRRTSPSGPHPLAVPRDSGQRARYVHEMLAKPNLVEEMHAQGFANQITEDLGLPGEDLVSRGGTSYDYPLTYMDQGVGAYLRNEKGPLSPGEGKEISAIFGSAGPLLGRVQQQGRDAALGSGIRRARAPGYDPSSTSTLITGR